MACPRFRSGRSQSLRKISEARLKPRDERFETLTIVQVSDISEVPQVERNIRVSLSDQNDLSAERVRNADLVKHVWISTRAIADDHLRSIDKRYNVLYDGRLFPDFI